MGQRTIKRPLRHSIHVTAQPTANVPAALRRRVMLEQWNTYTARVLQDFTPDQKKELRRAFYAGGEALLRAIIAALDAGKETTNGDLALMAAVEVEFAQFADDVKGGRA